VKVVELEIPPRSAYVGVVRLALASLGRSAELDPEAVDDLKIAVSEACANAVLANEEVGGDHPVSVSWKEEEDKITIEVGDRGDIYDRAGDDDSLSSGGISARVTMSVAMLTSIVDEFEISPRDGGGTSARFVVQRHR
jgi:serine/threonine-protein kinase RsbW